MTRRIFQYVPYTFAQDETAQPTYEAECVTGEVGDCAGESGPHRAPGAVEAWMRAHTQTTGHRRYLRIFSDYAVLQPPEDDHESARPGRGTD
jgi:hypothetical protein